MERRSLFRPRGEEGPAKKMEKNCQGGQMKAKKRECVPEAKGLSTVTLKESAGKV